jgi:hypothetical protein
VQDGAEPRQHSLHRTGHRTMRVLAWCMFDGRLTPSFL